MAFSKHFFEQFKDEVEKENKELEAKNEKKEVVFKRCSHKDVKFIKGELRCKCGASWSGSRLSLLFEKLTR